MHSNLQDIMGVERNMDAALNVKQHPPHMHAKMSNRIVKE